MRFTVLKSKLARRLAVVERIIPKKGGLPGHQVVSLRASASRLVLSVSGMKEQYRAAFDVLSVQTRGQMAIPAHELIRIVQVAPTGEITIDDSEQTIQVTSGAASWNITPLAEGDYVAADMVLPDESDSIDSLELNKALGDIRYAASTTDARPSLRQIRFGRERAVAADGRRLHQIPIEFGGEFSIPEIAVDTLVDALRAEGQNGIMSSPVKVYNTDQVIHFEHEGFVLSIGKLSYQFPDVDALILLRAREQEGSLVMDRRKFATALMVAAVSVGDVGHIEMSLQSGNTLRIKGTSTASQGTMHVELDDDSGMSGFVMVLPVETLLQAVVRLESDQITARVALPGQSDPGWFYVDDEGDEIAIRGVSQV